MMTEKWLNIADRVGYQVSDLGNIRSSSKPIKQFPNRNGYSLVSLRMRTFSVHRLVAKAFVPNPRNLPVVNHINGIKSDCRAVNLEWTTARGNSRHALINGLMSDVGENARLAKLTKSDVLEIANMLPYKSNTDIARIYNVHPTSISKIRVGKTWSLTLRSEPNK